MTRMDLLNAIEALEQLPHTGSEVKGLDQKQDLVMRHVLLVQEKLRDVWLRKCGERVQRIPWIPFEWVFSNVLRLLEEYPGGVTLAVLLTELAKSLEQKLARDADQEAGALCKTRKFRDTKDVEDFLVENEQEALQAKVVSYEAHRMTIELADVHHVVIHM